METTPQFNPISFQKGKLFEDFVEKNIFPISNYVLVHKTHDYPQNNERYVESSLKPDFKFRCKVSNLEFYVDAKYRSKSTNEDRYPVISENQFKRFKEIDSTEIPVYIALGNGSQPDNPETISLIPISKLDSTSVISLLSKEYLILKETLDYIGYYKKFISRDNKNESSKVEPLVNRNKNEIKDFKKTPRWILNSVLILAIILCIAGMIFLKPLSDNKTEQFVKNNIESYYADLSSNDLNRILPHINIVVERWYSLNRPSLFQISQDITRYSKKYPFKKINILWDTFKLSKLSNGYYDTEYMLDYSIKERVELKYRSYLLKIRAVWTEDMKLVNMSEEKLRRS